MRHLLLALPLLTCHLIAAAQQKEPPAGSNWHRVEALDIATSIHVNARTRHAVCILRAIDADTLTCEHDTGVGNKELVFQRAEIKTIKLARRGRSSVLAASIGAGTGAVAGGIEDIHSNYFAVHGAFAMIGALAGAFVGAPIGYLTDFARSTIYAAP